MIALCHQSAYIQTSSFDTLLSISNFYISKQPIYLLNLTLPLGRLQQPIPLQLLNCKEKDYLNQAPFLREIGTHQYLPIK
uniref:Uncharacterized protein n=1 Tax=Bartonella rochalimae ATCC BAA-1498 TaxID=685782 RepID=E6YM83_9HYPH|nr:hypothetical protein BARRO_50334 [Bartonella rochalimae ATCC BAA-1498]